MKTLRIWTILLGCLACAEQTSETLVAPDAATRDIGIVADAADVDAQTDMRPDLDGNDQGSSDPPDMDHDAAELDQRLNPRDVEIIRPLDAAPPDPCGTAIDLNAAMAARGFYEGDTRGFLSTTLGSCGGSAGGELLFRYTADTTDPVLFATDHPQTGAPTVLYLRENCQAEADLACVRGTAQAPGAQLIYTPPEPGSVVYLYVDTGSRDGGGAFRLTAGPPTGPACGDGRDNDGDGQIDLADPGCADAMGASEMNPDVPPLCADGLDNDEDGTIDYPADMDCGAAGADDERLECVPDMPCDGKNMGPVFNDGVSSGNLWQAYRWRAPQNAELTRLEIFSGEREGLSALWLYASEDDTPSMRLGGAGFMLQNAVGWQGVDLDAPIIVAADTDYWLVWDTIDGAQSPFEEGGERVDYKGSFDDGATWSRAFQNGVKYRIFCCDR